MTSAQSFVARIALSVPGAMATIALPAVSRFYRGTTRRFDRLLLICFAVSRLALFALVFGVLHIDARGDIPGFYLPEAEHALHGLIPYRGFLTSYAPLHPYIDAATIYLWHSATAIVLLAIVAEIFAVFVWLKVARSFAADTVCRTAALLYLAAPFSMQFVAIDGQDNVLLALTAALALYLILRNRFFASGAMIGLGVGSVKFLPLLWAPEFFAVLRERWRWVAGLVVPIVLVYGLFLLLHADLLYPLKLEAKLHSASDLPFLLRMITGFEFSDRLFDGFFLLIAAAAYVWIARLARPLSSLADPAAALSGRIRLLTFSMAAIVLLLLIFSKKSWPNYSMLVLFNLCLLPAFRSIVQRSVFALLQILSVTSHSYWASFLNLQDGTRIHARMLAHDRAALAFLPQQVLLLAGYFWLLALLVLELRRGGPNGTRSKQPG